MDDLRRAHNKYKNDLIVQCVRRGNTVLDCGCGRGGDWSKWKKVGARVTAVDPDQESLQEAIRRAEVHGVTGICIHQGDIRNVTGVFDAICYNFSIHYIRDSLEESAKALARRTRLGGLLFGITPDSDRMYTFISPDILGNSVTLDGDRAFVRLVDGPFYKGQARAEPLINREILETALGRWFTCEVWEPMCPPTELISDIYSKFVFRRKNVPP
jgi:SAM-dependent methyltransferase